MEDEQKVEETTAPSSEETKPAEEEVDETTKTTEEAKTVPYDRFSEVVAEKNKYKELLSTMETKPVEPVKVPTDFTGDTEDALKLIDERASSIVDKKLSTAQRKADLDNTIRENPDFFKYHEIIKAKIQDNPHLSWRDAYKLAKLDTSILEAKEEGKKEAYKKKEEKVKATVELTTKTKVASTNLDEIDPLAKGPDGKYLYTIKELEDILPKA